MLDVRNLFQFLLQHDRCVVFGNLSRYPHLIFEALAAVPVLRVVIVSNRCGISSTENRISVQRPTDPIHRCDLLVFVEPHTLQFVEKHPMASRVAVFASHYTFKIPTDGERWTNVSYFASPDPEGTKELISLQDFPIQTRNVGLVEVDHVNVLTISSGRVAAAATPSQSTYVIVDLTDYQKETLDMYLAFLDAFDFLLEHKNFIHRWVVCFPEEGRSAFNRFTQKVIDALLCKTFEYGNVRDHRDIVSLLPFYKSGTVDKTFDLKTSSFGGIQFAAPGTTEDACKVAVMHDTLPLAKNVLWIHRR